MKKEIITKNEYINHDFAVYYNQDYIKKGVYGHNPLLTNFKNTYNNYTVKLLEDSSTELLSILEKDIPELVKIEELVYPIIMMVPRAKKTKTYFNEQKYFQKTISNLAQKLKYEDGSYYIERVKNTITTHLPKTTIQSRIALIDGRPKEVYDNYDSLKVVPGITGNSCELKVDIRGREIILIDDIYTRNVNIDEDAISWLYRKGASKVIFYAVGFTKSGDNYEEILR